MANRRLLRMACIGRRTQFSVFLVNAQESLGIKKEQNPRADAMEYLSSIKGGKSEDLVA